MTMTLEQVRDELRRPWNQTSAFAWCAQLADAIDFHLSQPQPVAQGEAVDGEAFIIKYEDTDEADEVFIGYGAREIALKRYEQLSTAWSAHLFQRIHCNTDQSPMPAATPTIPTGQRVVPAEPTEAMEQAAADYLDFPVKAHGLREAILAAAPNAGGL